jgi:adenosine deaminase
VRDLVRLPKAHLHVHLESTVRRSTLRELAEANGLPVPGPPPAVFTGGLPGFVEHNGLIRDCLRRPEDFTRIAREYRADELAEGTRYAEVSFSAAAHGERLGDPEMPLRAVLAGLAEGDGPQCRVLLDTSRRRPVARAWESLRLAREYGLLGIGLAGDERYPATPFAPALDAARDAGLHLVHHAGETCGAASIREAITVGHTERLGHGIRVLDDPALVAEVRERHIPLEVCPTSNVALGLAPSLAEHPLPRLRAAGLMVTVNTDIPAVVGTALATEYERVRDAFGYGDEVLAELARNSFAASFAPQTLKTIAYREIDAWLSSA